MQGQGSTERVDPELLNARIAAIVNSITRGEASAVTGAALRCYAKLSDIDIRDLERGVSSQTPTTLWSRSNDAVASMWLALEELQQLLQPLAAHADEDAGFNLDALSSGEHAQTPGASVPVAVASGGSAVDPILLRIRETSWAMSFVLAGEVQRFRKRLAAVLKLKDGWELLDAVQDHIEHVRSGVVALLNGVFAALPRGHSQDVESEQSFELLSSRELRSRVFELRDMVLDVERFVNAKPAAEWSEPLKRLRDGVERFMFSPGFAWMRAGDKRAILSQREAFNDLLEMWSPLRAQPMQRVIGSFARFLEALEVINQREVLTVHDKAALATVVANLDVAMQSRGGESREAIGAALAALSDAQGRDRELDALLAQTLAPGNPIPVSRIRERAQGVLQLLGG